MKIIAVLPLLSGLASADSMFLDKERMQTTG